jgi:anti-sigma factor RsiW
VDCHDTWEVLEEFRRGELDPGVAAAVEAHLQGCPACRRLREGADAVSGLVRTLPRRPAPAGLARAIRQLEQPRRGGVAGWLGRPWVAAAVAALLVAAVLAPWVEFRGRRAEDPIERLLQAGVAEHTRILLQLHTLAADVSDPDSVFAQVRSLTDVEVPRAFAGSAELTLLQARPTVIANRKAAAVVLRDPAWFITTYFALSGRGLPMPNDRRVQIEQYRPYMRTVEGFNVIYWKQGEYAYVMVSDLDDPGTRLLFLKMRKNL